MEMDAFLCDLSTRLYKSKRLFERAEDGSVFLFAPDRPGLPVLVNNWVRDLLDAFEGGASVGDLLARGIGGERDLGDVFTTIGFLEEHGFLTNRSEPEPYGVSTDRYQKIPDSFSVWLSINNSCNLGCSYCFVEEMSKERQLMPRDILEQSVKRLVTTAKTNNTKEIVVKFAGGEPTLAAESMEFAYDYLTSELAGTETKLNFAVLSNGTAINDRIIRFLKRPGVGIGISVDGYGPYHDVHRVFKHNNSGSWDRIVRNVGRLKQEGIRPYIMATVTKESAPGLRQLVEWIFGEGLATRLNVVRSRYETSVDRGARKDDYAELVDACKKGFEEVFDYLDEHHETVDMANQLHVCELSFDYPLNGPACGIGRSHVVFDYLGKLTDCVMTLHAAKTPATENLLQDVPRTVDHMPYDPDSAAGQSECYSCEWFPVCGGGCPTANTRVNGHPYTVSPLCDFYKYVIPRYLDTLGKNMAARHRSSLEQANS